MERESEDAPTDLASADGQEKRKHADESSTAGRKGPEERKKRRLHDYTTEPYSMIHEWSDMCDDSTVHMIPDRLIADDERKYILERIHGEMSNELDDKRKRHAPIVGAFDAWNRRIAEGGKWARLGSSPASESLCEIIVEHFYSIGNFA